MFLKVSKGDPISANKMTVNHKTIIESLFFCLNCKKKNANEETMISHKVMQQWRWMILKTKAYLTLASVKVSVTQPAGALQLDSWR